MVLVTIICISLTYCSPKTTSINLPIDTPENFSVQGVTETPDKWWTVFEDEQLNSLIDSALQNNMDLQTTWYRLQESQAIIDRVSAEMYPSFDGSAQAEINNRQSEFQQSQRFRIGLYSEYEIDLWGRINSSVEAQQFRAAASFEDYQTAVISLSAEISRTWYNLVVATNQLQLAENQVETNEKTLSLIKIRFGSGQIRGVDILRQIQLLEATKEQKINAELNVKILENQLAVLVGKSPQEKPGYLLPPLPEPPALPDPGIPATLIQRRPDVRSAYNLLQAADREAAAAISNKYPRLTLSASISSGAYDIEDLFTDLGRGIAANLLAPVFRGGELNAEADRAEALKQQRLYQYGNVVLTAFREVEDALVQEQKQIQIIKSIQEQVELAAKTIEQLKTEYLNGMSNYLDVLTALDEEQQLRRDLLRAKLALIEYRIALYRALAGGLESQQNL
ncbi:TolC family protein [Draconibacterium halophilum]|uniref:TolC family protein n=2 Tax=Draconibacterium halophilum TaxID=2706887 RepID=A0A6C0RHE3_9BACT|nr:TolC family protein [Draconibacterium halophilum]